jgi:plastocyanin
MKNGRVHEVFRRPATWLAFAAGLSVSLLGSPNSNAQAKGEAGSPQTHTKVVRIWDACDPQSFDQAVKPGTCEPGLHGQTQFTDFLGELQLDKIAGGWRFNPLVNTTEGTLKLQNLELQPGDQITFQNVGGETHTFTKVEKFAGGFFAPLNPLTGNPDPAPECAKVLADGSLAPQPETATNQFVEAGTTEVGPIAGTPTLPLGVTHWQCCIHPWMRMNVVVRDRGHDQER